MADRLERFYGSFPVLLSQRAMVCKEKERQRSDYRKAVEADNAAIRRGDRNFKGIGLKNK